MKEERLITKNLGILSVNWVTVLLFVSSCSTLPEVKHEWAEFPKEGAYYGKPKRKFKVLGWVRDKVEFPTLDPAHDEGHLCKNYFNKAVNNLVDYAKENGGDAVVDVRSVVFYFDGTSETLSRPECSDEGAIGQVLVRGIAVKWVKEKRRRIVKPRRRMRRTSKK